MAPQKERLLRLAIAHYRNPECPEDAVHRFVQSDHAVKAARVHEKYGLAAYGFLFSPSPLRDALMQASSALQNGWIISDADLTVEFYFHDIEEAFQVAKDPDFRAIQAEESPYIRADQARATLAWVERYIEDGRVVNVDEEGRYLYGSYEEQSNIKMPFSASE